MTNAVIALAAALAIGLYGGYQYRDTQAEQEALESAQRAIKQANEQWAIDREILEESTDTQEKIVTVFKEIERDATETTATDCRDLGSDWRRVYSDAIKAANEAASYK